MLILLSRGFNFILAFSVYISLERGIKRFTRKSAGHLRHFPRPKQVGQNVIEGLIGIMDRIAFVADFEDLSNPLFHFSTFLDNLRISFIAI